MTSLTKDSDGPDAKRKRIAMPAYMEKVHEDDTELHNDNPFQRTEFERVKKARMIGKWSKWFQVVESILEGSDDPVKIRNTGGFIVYLLKERVLEIWK